jgi:hypothetical protein
MSTVLFSLSGSGSQAAPYPFTTQYPEPGMMSPVGRPTAYRWVCVEMRNMTITSMPKLMHQ